MAPVAVPLWVQLLVMPDLPVVPQHKLHQAEELVTAITVELVGADQRTITKVVAVVVLGRLEITHHKTTQLMVPMAELV